MEVQLHLFLKSTLDIGEWSVSSYGHFKRGEKAPVPIECDAGCVSKLVSALQETQRFLVSAENQNTGFPF